MKHRWLYLEKGIIELTGCSADDQIFLNSLVRNRRAITSKKNRHGNIIKASMRIAKPNRPSKPKATKKKRKKKEEKRHKIK